MENNSIHCGVKGHSSKIVDVKADNHCDNAKTVEFHGLW